MKGWFNRIFGVDIRSLAVLRIGLALLLLADLAVRATDLQAHYTDAGVLPRELLVGRYQHTCVWSIHLLTGSLAGQAGLFTVAAVAAVALLIGLFTRTAAVISWVLLVSLHARNPMITNGGDLLLRSLLFWGIFLPLDGCWAVRPRRGQSFPRDRTVSVASMAILIQVALMYWISGYYKLHGVWRSPDGLLEILKTDSYARPLAYVLIQHPVLVAWLARTALWSELILPLLVFSPWGTIPIRLLAIVWFCLFHVGIQLTLTVGQFAFACCLAWSLFLPSEIWNRWVPMRDGTPAGLSLDGSIASPAHLKRALEVDRRLRPLSLTRVRDPVQCNILAKRMDEWHHAPIVDVCGRPPGLSTALESVSKRRSR